MAGLSLPHLWAACGERPIAVTAVPYVSWAQLGLTLPAISGAGPGRPPGWASGSLTPQSSPPETSPASPGWNGPDVPPPTPQALDATHAAPETRPPGRLWSQRLPRGVMIKPNLTPAEKTRPLPKPHPPGLLSCSASQRRFQHEVTKPGVGQESQMAPFPWRPLPKHPVHL